ncbi:flagellar basal body-associated FliL family protein [Clostridium tepidum]|jgi:flagellar basal body-associated protein FliL|uniref:Flagellar protein FliL n=1 Tax=Clostridium tepidum TaxID=1962263 RepID=A0A1S9IHC8_9CLOT|nr:flagellar basal body-associated FliL family protein [Clostridium tepidum]MCR1933646.1 flagellar basal body-associated FliL family protein [Clostridium tepidum]MDU6876841.1 flagellar basal body-associated FliL family protein [Clostridium botulinum]OOO63576.1 flagellar basal body protein FliL [Clostridium tepidum]OOO69724.1 flagellar basal body protein FliL [Clostridium tepidum]
MSEKNVETKGGNFKKIIIIVFILVAVGAGSFGGYMLFIKNNKPNNTNQMPVNNTNVINSQQTTNGMYPQQVVVSSKTYSLDEFLVNLADEDGKRFVKAKIYIGYEEKKLTKELEEKKPILRDAVIGVLRSKKAADINPKNIDKIKLEIINKIAPMLEKGRINSIYFDDLIVQ